MRKVGRENFRCFEDVRNQGLLIVRYANQGDPYREGAEIEICDLVDYTSIRSFIDMNEVRELRDLFNQLLGENK